MKGKINMKNALIIIGIVIAIVFIGGCSIISFRNNLINKEETISQQWAEVENQLQRRYDLIPNLIATVKGYAKHETEIFSKLAEARASMMSAKSMNEKAEAEANMNSALSRLMAIAENYPNLKADSTFIRLMDELAGTENRIAVARKRYNDSVKDFNSSIRQFPGSMFGFEQKEYFNPPAKGKMEEAPKVEF
jgi:LemA protein